MINPKSERAGRISSRSMLLADGDRQMLEWTGGGTGARLKMLVHHDDVQREYAYGLAGGLPDRKIGTILRILLLEAVAERNRKVVKYERKAEDEDVDLSYDDLSGPNCYQQR